MNILKYLSIMVFSKDPQNIFITLSSKYTFEFIEKDMLKYYNGEDIEYEENAEFYII